MGWLKSLAVVWLTCSAPPTLTVVPSLVVKRATRLSFSTVGGGATCLVGSELYHIVGAKHTGIVGLVETEAEHRGGVDIIIYIIVAVCTGGGDKHHHQQRYDIS